MVMFWSRSDWSASMRLAHSKGTPRRSAIFCNCSSLPSGSDPVSWRRRPTNVDLPWSTWPTMTILSCSVVAGEKAGRGVVRGDGAGPLISHVAIASEFFKGVFAFLVLGASGAFGHVRGAEFLDDFADIAGAGFDGRR